MHPFVYNFKYITKEQQLHTSMLPNGHPHHRLADWLIEMQTTFCRPISAQALLDQLTLGLASSGLQISLGKLTDLT